MLIVWWDHTCHHAHLGLTGTIVFTFFICFFCENIWEQSVWQARGFKLCISIYFLFLYDYGHPIPYMLKYLGMIIILWHLVILAKRQTANITYENFRLISLLPPITRLPKNCASFHRSNWDFCWWLGRWYFTIQNSNRNFLYELILRQYFGLLGCLINYHPYLIWINRQN